MGSCEPGQAGNGAALIGHPFVQRASRSPPAESLANRAARFFDTNASLFDAANKRIFLMVDEPNAAREGEYVVVARRYRPQRFEELIGQEHVARALSNAITTNRV